MQRTDAPPSFQTAPKVNSQLDHTKDKGSALKKETRSFMESRFGADLSNIRIHTGNTADQLSRQLNAAAFTIGDDIYFSEGRYSPDTVKGKQLLAHELTHTIQQRERSSIPFIQRFEEKERSQITSLDPLMQEAKAFAENAYSVGGFVEQAGGTTVSGTTDTAMTKRYLVTCSCGMIDMRHFYQLMYLAFELSNRIATSEGREHELVAEPSSRFSAEDTPSNALGAYFGTTAFDLFYTSEQTFLSRLKDFLLHCNPINFNNLPKAEQDAIVEFYSKRDAKKIPVNQNETAIPKILSIGICNNMSRAFPFELDKDDQHQKTITGKK